MNRRWFAVALAVSLAAGACTSQPPVSSTSTTLPPAAEPQSAPPQTSQIPGRTVSVDAAPEGVVANAVTRNMAVAKRNPNGLVLINADTDGTVQIIDAPS